MPEAGSGGSGAEIEICTVQFELGDVPLAPPFTVYYTDINFVPQILNDFGWFAVPKNTIIAIDGWSSTALASGATQLFYDKGLTAYRITANAVLTFE